MRGQGRPPLSLEHNPDVCLCAESTGPEGCDKIERQPFIIGVVPFFEEPGL